MFQRELDLAANWAEQLHDHLDAAANAPRIGDVQTELRAALEAAWRMESALGEFLAEDERKIWAIGMAESALQASQAFDALKPALADADGVHRRSEAEMKAWIAKFHPSANRAIRMALEARRAMPPASSDRIQGPVGEAEPASAGATVSIARTRHQNLSTGDVERLIDQALQPLGGLARFVGPGQTVLLKPNQTGAALSDEGSTTDPRVVAALARMCYAAGAARVIVGESAGGGSKTNEVMDVTGVSLLARRAGAEVVDFQTCPQREVDVPEGKYIKRILLPAPLLDADVVINLPKLKTHNWDWISGALKNWVGIVRPDVRSQHHDWHTFDEYVDLLFRVRPALNVMDGIIRGVGNGPLAGEGEFYGGILASTDPVALDVVAAQVLGFDPTHIGFVAVASDRGLGVADPNQVAVVGVPLREAIQPGKPPEMGVDFYGANVIVGRGVSRAGTLGHFKSMGDVFHGMSTWEVIERLHGKATILIGDAEDPLFSEHLSEGPYVVLDDAAPERYRQHPGVYAVPGHPVLHNLEKYLLVGLRISALGNVALQAMNKVRLVESRLEYESPHSVVPLVSGIIAAGRRLPIPVQVALIAGTAGAVALGVGLGVGRVVQGAARNHRSPAQMRQTALGTGWRLPKVS